MTLLTSVRCARRTEVLGPVTAFAPTILVPGIRPRSTRWKVEEKVASFFCPQAMGCHSAGVVTQSKAEWGGTSGKEHRPPGCGKCKYLSLNLLSLQGLWATQAVLPRLESSLQIWPLVD